MQAAEIAGRVFQVRFGDFNVEQPRDGIDVDRTHLGALSDHLPMQLAFLGNIDDQIAGNARLAAEPTDGRQRTMLVDVALFGLVPGSDVITRGHQRMLGEFALGDFNLAASADAASPAHRI